MNKNRIIQCLYCNSEKKTNQPTTKFCSANCRVKYARKGLAINEIKVLDPKETTTTNDKEFISEDKVIVIGQNPHEYFTQGSDVAKWVKQMRESISKVGAW